MVPMLVVRPTLKIDILKMEQAFHMGYREGDKVFLFFFDELEGQRVGCFFALCNMGLGC
jgi:hypothetical protein